MCEARPPFYTSTKTTPTTPQGGRVSENSACFYKDSEDMCKGGASVSEAEEHAFQPQEGPRWQAQRQSGQRAGQWGEGRGASRADQKQAGRPSCDSQVVSRSSLGRGTGTGQRETNTQPRQSPDGEQTPGAGTRTPSGGSGSGLKERRDAESGKATAKASTKSWQSAPRSPQARVLPRGAGSRAEGRGQRLSPQKAPSETEQPGPYQVSSREEGPV